MPFIGLEEDRAQKELTEEEIEKVAEEIKNQPVADKEEISLSASTIARLKECHSKVVVYDYGDGYHKSTEELANENQLYVSYRKIEGKKRKYGKLDEYISAVRDCLNFMKEVSERQNVYEPEHFRTLVAKGKITINGMYIPKYTGKDKNKISKTALAEYILGDGDPKKFLDDDVQKVNIDSEDVLAECLNWYFTSDEVRWLFSDMENSQDIQNEMIDESEMSSYENKPFAADLTEEEQKNLMKNVPGLAQIVTDVMKNNQDGLTYGSSMIYDMREDDLDVIEKYDQAYGYTSSSDFPQFTGSLLNKGDYEEYMAAIDNWEWENTRIRYSGKVRTLPEVNELVIKEELEKYGYNPRLFWGNNDRSDKIEEYLKKERKKEKRLKKQLMGIQKEKKKRNRNPKAVYRQMKDAEKATIKKEEKKAKKKKSEGP